MLRYKTNSVRRLTTAVFIFFRFDSETQNLMNDLRQEKAQRERLAREKEIAIAEKFTIEQNLSVSIVPTRRLLVSNK